MFRFMVGAGLIAALGTFAAPDTAVAQDKTICFVTFSLQIAYFQSSVAGGQSAADELGVELVVLDPQADAGRQVTQVEDCISRNVDAIVVDPIESSSLIGVLDEAGARNIPIATLDTKVDSPHVVTLIGVPQREHLRASNTRDHVGALAVPLTVCGSVRANRARQTHST